MVVLVVEKRLRVMLLLLLVESGLVDIIQVMMIRLADLMVIMLLLLLKIVAFVQQLTTQVQVLIVAK